MNKMNRWSSDDSEGKNEIPIGTSVCMGDSYPQGAEAKIVRKASIKEILAEGDEILYWLEYVNNNYPAEYAWRSNLYPVLLEDSLVQLAQIGASFLQLSSAEQIRCKAIAP